MMKLDLQNLLNISELIVTMDKHPLGASLFVVSLLLLCVAAPTCIWLQKR